MNARWAVLAGAAVIGFPVLGRVMAESIGPDIATLPAGAKCAVLAIAILLILGTVAAGLVSTLILILGPRFD